MFKSIDKAVVKSTVLIEVNSKIQTKEGSCNSKPLLTCCYSLTGNVLESYSEVKLAQLVGATEYANCTPSER